MNGCVIWFTGLPCCGKSTIAKAVLQDLKDSGIKSVLLDGDVIRKHLWKELGFSKEDRDENIRRVAYLSSILAANGIVVLTSFISPYRELRYYARNQVDKFIEVYVKCPVGVCIERDVKGMYKKALSGEIHDFTGISAPYEAPLNPEVVIESDKESVAGSVTKVIKILLGGNNV